MTFTLVCIGMIVGLGIFAWIANHFDKGDDTIAKIADEVIELPDVLECLEPLVATIPLQLLAYHVAVCKGKNVDQPRNLAKSVTVE